MNIEVILTPGDFIRFSMFDTFRRKKMWRSPVIFSGILGTCGVISFCMRHVEGALMLGTILLLVGVGMPLFYFLSFFASVLMQVKKQKLPRYAYTLTLSRKPEFMICNETQQLEYSWDKVYRVYRDKTATYLYATADRAFILPHCYVEGGSKALWTLLQKNLPADKLTVL